MPDTLSAPLQLEAETPLFTGPNWDFGGLRRVYDAVEQIAFDELGLDVYPVQIEVITSEQMLDAYASVGLPLMYRHWSFGKRFAYHETLYRKGLQGLAYEIVINSNPCICYIMEENSMTMQTLVIAHAAFGHNHFFKNNYLFRQWTDADGILDYLAFARDYVAKCEERYGIEAVERVLDAAHALKDHGVNRYAHRAKPNLAEERQRAEERRGARARRPTTISGAPCRRRTRRRTSMPTRRSSSCRRSSGRARPARGEPALLHREARAAARGLAARAGPHRPHDRAVLLSAEADADDERGLRHLRAITRS